MATQLNLNTLHSFPNSPKFSFQGRSETNLRAKAPGPGQYVALTPDKDKYSNMPKYSMGKPGGEEKPIAKGPGPGSYVPCTNPKYDLAPKYSMGTGSRLPKTRSEVGPGPCKYDVRGNIDGVKYSMKGLNESSSRASTPGPGSYNKDAWKVSSGFDNSARFSFQGGSRGELKKSKAPGPGSYETTSTLCGNNVMKSPGKYSMRHRHPMPHGDNTPGPPSAGTTFQK